MQLTYLHWSKVTVVLGWHAHGRVDRWRRRRTVRSAGGTRIVLAASPTETDARVSDGVTLHLVDGHLGGVALDELDKTAALTRWDFDIGDLAKALEKGTELILGNISRKTADENSGVVGIGELIHWLGRTVETAHWWALHAVHANWTAPLHARHSTWPTTLVLVLGSSSADAHWPVAAVDALHLLKRALLVGLIREAHETVTARKPADRVRHDLCGLA